MNAQPQPQPQTPVSTPPSARALRAFGVGNAGVSLLEHLARNGVGPQACVAINSDASSLAVSSAAEKVCLETRLFRGLGTGGDPERGRAAAEEQMPHLKALCAGARTVLIVAGLGGGAGTGISPVLAAAAKQSGALVLAFMVLPFECEGTLRAELAQDGLERLRVAADLVICFPNQKALTLIGETTSLKDTFKTSDQLLGNCLRFTCRALAGESVMGLPFSDLCLLLRQRSADCAMAVAEATGPNRAAEVVEALLAHPVLAGSEGLQENHAVGICVLGGQTLTIVEVDRIMEQVHHQCQGTPVMMGALVSAGLTDKLLVALMAARPGATGIATPSDEDENKAGAGHDAAAAGMGLHLLDRTSTARPHSRFVPPPPALSPEKMQQLRARHAAGGGRSRNAPPRLRQSQLPLEIVSKGRFDKSQPTIHKGEDLDVPTYIRRGVALN